MVNLDPQKYILPGLHPDTFWPSSSMGIKEQGPVLEKQLFSSLK